MQRSNTYIIIFSVVLTIILGGMLSIASVGLKPLQDKQVELDTKKKILGAVTDISTIEDPNELLALYDQRVESIVVDFEGNIVETNAKGEPIVAEKISVQKNYRMKPEDRVYPVYKFKAEDGSIDAYVFPMWGNGLWDWISAYMAIDKDLNTVRGIAFDHKAETPGLGERITTEVIQSRYVGKEIFNDSGELESITMVKGENNTGLSIHEVDGMAGATMTAKGVNAMLDQYLGCYQPYIKKVKSEGNKVALTQ